MKIHKLVLLVLFWASFPAHAIEPVAKLAGPATIAINHEVILSSQGTVSQGEPDYEIALAPEGSETQIIPLYNKDQQLVYGIVVPDKEGLYRFAVVASAIDP